MADPLLMVDVCSLCGAPMRDCWCQKDSIGANPKPRPRFRSTSFLKFVRGLPCCVEGCNMRNIEAAHFGARGVSRKVHDCLAIPLCKQHHDEAHHYCRAWEFYDRVRDWQIRTMTAYLMRQ